jgi:hypothetical protein
VKVREQKEREGKKKREMLFFLAKQGECLGGHKPKRAKGPALDPKPSKERKGARLFVWDKATEARM